MGSLEPYCLDPDYFFDDIGLGQTMVTLMPEFGEQDPNERREDWGVHGCPAR